MGEKPLPKTPSLTKRSSSSMSASGKQQSILGFFSKTPQSGPSTASAKATNKSAPTTNSSPCLKENTNLNSLQLNKKRPSNTTPVPSSDAIEPSSSQENHSDATVKVFKSSFSSAVTPADVPVKKAAPVKMVVGSSPSRKVRLNLRLSKLL